MIQPAFTPTPGGRGRVAQKLREQQRLAKAAYVTGKGTSRGPLGTTVRAPSVQQQPATTTGGTDTWAA